MLARVELNKNANTSYAMMCGGDPPVLRVRDFLKLRSFARSAFGRIFL